MLDIMPITTYMYYNYAIVHKQYCLFNVYISKVKFQPVVLYIMLRCSALSLNVSCSIIYSWENLCLILYHLGIITKKFIKIAIKVVISMSTNLLIMTFNRLHWSFCCNFPFTYELNSSYYAGNMLNVLNNLLCSNYADIIAGTNCMR